MATLTLSWLAAPVEQVAPRLLGWRLERHWPDGRCQAGRIIEVEAYGPDDPACHGYRGPTPRNRSMFAAAGTVYVYRIYGIHHCLNLVTGQAGEASAVLIRALELDPPEESRAAAGPGKLCRVWDLDLRHDGSRLGKGALHLLPPDRPPPSVVQTVRIGIRQGAEMPWRWYLPDSPAVSRRDRRAEARAGLGC
jgi:DNA-3-methyladenine glycosylase